MLTSKPTILLVEDELDLQEIILDLCATKGINLLAVDNGVDAWALLQKQAVQAVFSDVNLPRMDGLELLRRVRARYPRLPFLFWSGYLERSVLDSAKEFGRVEFLEKPFSFSALDTALDRLLRVSDEA